VSISLSFGLPSCGGGAQGSGVFSLDIFSRVLQLWKMMNAKDLFLCSRQYQFGKRLEVASVDGKNT
jgi:hypothetical protein